MKHDRVAQTLRAPFAGFFALSVAVHLLIFFVWPKARITYKSYDPIAVSLLPLAEETKANPRRQIDEIAPRTRDPVMAQKIAPQGKERRLRDSPGYKDPSPDRTSNETRANAGVTAKKITPDVEQTSTAPAETMIPKDSIAEEPPLPPRQPVPDNSMVAKNYLPSIQDLLPHERRIPLDTKEPRYASYLEYVRRAIDFNWEYPQLALLYGLQGKLLVEFTILANGNVEFLTLVRSSGSTLLDEEALRAIRSASPFPRIPTSINANRLLISASMEYYDGRLKYRLGP